MHTIHRVQIDQDGHLPIPAEVWAKMGLAPGATVAIEASDAQVITLRSVSDELSIVEEHGIRVIASQVDEPLTTFLERDREARGASAVGGIDL